MLYRNIINKLELWRKSPNLKPLILRGARQVGKTSAVREFGKKNFASYIELNLEREQHKALFTEVGDTQNLIKNIEAFFNQRIIFGKTLIFIDEIQFSSMALQQLRYFHEDCPNLHLIAAGSLLDLILKRENFSFPVGRVEFLYIYPLTFDEFLLSQDKSILLAELQNASITNKLSSSFHQQALKLLREYLLIGGMPEVVNNYKENNSIVELNNIYESLLTGFIDDIPKYSSNSQAVYIRHVLNNAPLNVGMQITYSGFGESSFKSREIGQAFSTLDMAMLINQIWSSRSIAQPLVENKRKSPKLIFLDTGLANYKLGNKHLLGREIELENIYKGQISEQLVGQTLLALNSTKIKAPNYWYRDKKGSSAELDYLITYEDQLIGIEVKSGTSAVLKSLHQFALESKKLGSDCKLLVRIYSGELKIEELKIDTSQKCRLLSIPFYLVWRIESLLRENL